jgi:hypothetical protein
MWNDWIIGSSKKGRIDIEGEGKNWEEGKR